jgi:hypothetical protein
LWLTTTTEKSALSTHLLAPRAPMPPPLPPHAPPALRARTKTAPPRARLAPRARFLPPPARPPSRCAGTALRAFFVPRAPARPRAAPWVRTGPLRGLQTRPPVRLALRDGTAGPRGLLTACAPRAGSQPLPRPRFALWQPALGRPHSLGRTGTPPLRAAASSLRAAPLPRFAAWTTYTPWWRWSPPQEWGWGGRGSTTSSASAGAAPRGRAPGLCGSAKARPMSSCSPPWVKRCGRGRNQTTT